MKKYFSILLLLFASTTVSAQTDLEKRDLKFDSTDLKIIQRADIILSDSSKWNKNDDRVCDDDISTGKFSIYCALYKASMDVVGKFDHRKAALQLVRFTIEKYEQGRVKEHRMMDWNNHPETSFAEVKKVLTESADTIKTQLR